MARAGEIIVTDVAQLKICIGLNCSCVLCVQANTVIFHFVVSGLVSGLGGLEVACWPLVPRFAGSNPAEAVGFFQGEKNPQHAFLRKGSKAVCPMS